MKLLRLSAFGCGKSTLLKRPESYLNDLVEGCKITGKVLLDGEDIYGDMNINLLRKRVGMGISSETESISNQVFYDNIAYESENPRNPF